VRIKDHEIFASKIGEHLNFLLSESGDAAFGDDLRRAWLDLQMAKPDITNFEDIKNTAVSLLFEQKVNIIVLNSTSPMDVNYSTGFNIVAGGVNFFPNEPIQDFTQEIDKILAAFPTEKETELASFDVVRQLLQYVGSNETYDWDNRKFINCVQSLSVKRPSTKCHLIIRRNRDISKGTGTLLSPTDRKTGDKLPKALVLTLYRVNGNSSKGWNGKPFWIPNIKFPDDSCFYDVAQ
jgi:hypothetical protein